MEPVLAGMRVGAEPSLEALTNDLVTLIIARLDPAQRRAAAPVCRRWARVVRGLQTQLVLRDVAARPPEVQAALGPALCRRAVARLACWGSDATDAEWLGFACGVLACTLRELWVRGRPWAGMPWLGGLQRLQDLSVSGCADSLPPALSALRQLTRLAAVCTQLDVHSPSSLPRTLTALRTLRLGHYCLAPGSGAALARVAGSLRELVLQDCALPREDALLLGQVSGLTALEVMGTVVGIDGPGAAEEDGEGQQQEGTVEVEGWAAVPLAGLTALRALVLDRCGLPAVPESVTGLSSLSRLQLWGNGIEALPEGPYIARLGLLDARENPLPLHKAFDWVKRSGRAPQLRWSSDGIFR